MVFVVAHRIAGDLYSLFKAVHANDAFFVFVFAELTVISPFVGADVVQSCYFFWKQHVVVYGSVICDVVFGIDIAISDLS